MSKYLRHLAHPHSICTYQDCFPNASEETYVCTGGSQIEESLLEDVCLVQFLQRT